MSDLILREFNGKSIRQRADGFLSLTDMCKAGGNLFADWYKLKSTKEFLATFDLSDNAHYDDRHSSPIEVNKGNLGDESGTWGHEEVAILLASWIDPILCRQVVKWTRELLTRGVVDIRALEPPAPARPKLSPAESAASLMETLRFFDIEPNDPRYKQGLRDLILNMLEINPRSELSCPSEIWLGVAERAQQLGISTKLVTAYRSTLGVSINQLTDKGELDPSDRREETRLRNGTQQTIKIYRISDNLDAAILAFFDRKRRYRRFFLAK